jgi:hypothetical protein
MIDRRDCRGNRWHPQDEQLDALALQVKLADLEAKHVSAADLAACLSWRDRAAREIERRAS